MRLFLLSAFALADVYIHNPRGSNDRCDEKSNDRNNANRLYNSQNNAAGGYAVCPSNMQFYEDTDILIQWTAQHGCGSGEDPNNKDVTRMNPGDCQVVIQIGCENGFKKVAGDENYQLTNGVSLNKIGTTCTSTRPVTSKCTPQNAQEQCATLDLNNQTQLNTFNSDACRCHPRKYQTYGLHEPELNYLKCTKRSRNRGLYIANQNPRNDATGTRQQPNSDRYGFQCPEERDYYPYWHPTGWYDVAVMTSDVKMCDYYRKESENVKGRHECLSATNEMDQEYWQINTQEACNAKLGSVWMYREPHNIPAPDCVQAEWQVDNHLGMSYDPQNKAHPMTGEPSHHQQYKWRIPESLVPKDQDSLKCVLRVRYNISTSEVNFFADAKDNGKVKPNPVVTYGDRDNADTSLAMPLRMAINTAQYGRTFEDRTEVFDIKKRQAILKGKRIHNLNVKGKRGNIAQVRNCVEYDFVPKTLETVPGDFVHFQWCGSDYNSNGNDGEGRDGTDRSNIVAIKEPQANMPHNISIVSIFSQEDVRKLAWIDQDPTKCYNVSESITNQKDNDQSEKSCHYLNGAPSPYFSHIAEVKDTGRFHYMSSRNNNFSNRSQKGLIVSSFAISTGAVAAIAVVACSAVGAAVFLFWKRAKRLGFKFESLLSRNRL